MDYELGNDQPLDWTGCFSVHMYGVGTFDERSNSNCMLYDIEGPRKKVTLSSILIFLRFATGLPNSN